MDNRRAAAAGLEMLQPVSRAAKVAKTVARAIAIAGPKRFLGSSRIAFSGQPECVGEVFGPDSTVAYFTGTDGPHRKTSLQVMSSSGAILGYVKLSQAAHIRPYIRNEAETLNRVAALGLSSADVPKSLMLRDDAALSLLVTDSVKSAKHAAPLQPGQDHLNLLAELRAKTEQIGAGPVLAHATQSITALAALAGPDWQERIARAVAALQPFSDQMPLCLTHGDFTPWNTFVQSGRLYVFDWEYAETAWPVGFDLAHFLLATIPPDLQPERLPVVQNALATAHFEGDQAAAKRALLLSLVCHAIFYLRRLDEGDCPLSDWPEGKVRGAMIDRLLDGGVF